MSSDQRAGMIVPQTSGATVGKQAHLALTALSEMAPKVAPFPPDADRVERNKPRGGGLWTSTYTPDATHVSAWAEWCHWNDFGTGPHGLWVLTPTDDARLLLIDSLDDLRTLHDAYGKPSKYYPSVPAWERIVADFDGVHLTEKGQAETHLSHPIDLYGWDCESTVWFRWVFTSVERVGEVEIKGYDYGADDDE